MELYFLPILTTEELLALKGQANLVILDASNDKKAYQNYKAGHLEGALFVDIHTQLASVHTDAAQGGRHPLPTVSAFVKVLGKLGIKPDSHVVIYDHANGANAAARMWWMLKSVGHQKVQVLSGGFAKANRAGYPLSSIAREPEPTDYEAVSEWLLPQVDIETVDKAFRDSTYTIIDVREEKRYRGEHEPIDLIAGHIPHAINIPFLINFDEEGLFQERRALRDFYNEALANRDPDKVIVHCGSGVTACHTILSMYYAGLPIPKLYVGSWSEWSRNDKPIVKAD